MDSIYNRYALGLFSIAEDENKVEIYKDEIKNINILLKENEDLIQKNDFFICFHHILLINMRKKNVLIKYLVNFKFIHKIF